MIVLEIIAPIKSQQQSQQNTNSKPKHRKGKTVSFETLLKMAMEKN
jgi:hypothetical protein